MKHSKACPILIILTLAFSTILLTFTPDVLAATPSVPEFTVKYADHSYEVPITHWTTTDPYTGTQTTHTSGGEHVDNRTIDVTIHNQPFTPYLDGNNTVNLYYNVRSKGHFADWGTESSGSQNQNGIQASTGSDTVVSFFIQDWGISPGGQIDFQVQAVLSYIDQSYSGGCFTGSQTTSVAQSDWSNTQTVTVSSPTYSNATTPPISTPNPTFNPYYPTATPFPLINPTTTPILPSTQTGGLFGFDWVQTALIVMAIVIAVLVVALVAVTWRRTATE